MRPGTFHTPGLDRKVNGMIDRMLHQADLRNGRIVQGRDGRLKKSSSKGRKGK